jgi:hypothetical protein
LTGLEANLQRTFMDAVVIVDPVPYQRRHDERDDVPGQTRVQTGDVTGATRPRYPRS